MFYPSLRMAKPSIKLIKDNIKNSNFEIAVFILHNFGYVSRDRVAVMVAVDKVNNSSNY